MNDLNVDWPTVKLKSIAKCSVGIASSATHAYTDKGILLIRNQNIKEGKLDLSDVLYVTEEYEQQHKSKRLREGDIVTVRTGYPGISSVVPKELEGAQSFTTLIIRKKTNDISSSFLCYYINSDIGKAFFNSNKAGGGQKNVGSKTLESMDIPTPTFPEQQKIAEILSTVDAKIDVIDQQITETQELKKGLMQRLLTKGIGHTEFKDSPLGEIPKSWKVVKVGDVCKLKGGFAFKSSDSTEYGVRWVKIANVGVHKIKWETESFLPEGYDEKHPDFVLKTNDVVIAMTRPILSGELKIAKITEKDSGSLLNQRVGKIVTSDGIDSEYSYQVFNSSIFINSMEKELVGTDPPNISSKMFEELMIPLPPLSEQVEIVDILNTVDDKKQLLTSKLMEFKKLKKGLMQQLLTGKIRVNCLINKTVNV